jgi:uncharacterized membrane protein
MKKLIIAKTISWYAFHFCMVSLLGTIITKEWTVGVKLASAEMLFETFLYYWHEHLWIWIKEKLRWS